MNSQCRIECKYFLQGNTLKLFIAAFFSIILRWSAFSGSVFVIYKILFKDTVNDILNTQDDFFVLIIKFLSCFSVGFLLFLFESEVKTKERYIFFKKAKGEKLSAYSILKPQKLKNIIKFAFLYLKINLLKLFWLVFYAFPCVLCICILIYVKTVSQISSPVFLVLCFGCSIIISLCLFMYTTTVFRYYCAPYFLILNSRTKTSTALEKSLCATDKYLQEAMLFKTSFSGWWISCFAFLPVFYVLPYYKLCKAMFIYNCMKKEKKTVKESNYAINYLRLEKNQESI